MRVDPILLIALLILPGVVMAADVKTISRGSRVDVSEHLVPGKLTLIDFYADWCGGCKAIEPRVAALASRHQASLAVRKVDVVRWGSAVARQYEIESLPRLDLYGRDGERLATGSASGVLRRLERELASAPVVPAPESGSAPAAAERLPVRRPLSPVVLVVGGMLAAGAVVLLLRAGPWLSSRTPPGEARSSQWYVERADRLEGPYSARELARLRGDGQVRDDTPVCRKHDAERMTVAEALAAGGASAVA